MIVWGGWSANAYEATGGRYQPATDMWLPTSTVGAPSARYEHTAVWTGSEMIVWGGRGVGSSENVLGLVSTGGRYNPTTDQWLATTATGAPAARFDHTAVWTGTEMVVWGGFGGSGGTAPGTNTGARYNPITDQWQATNSSGAPAARWNHAAVWSGQEMIVWGGTTHWVNTPNVNYVGTNSGGRYNPATNSWVAINLTGAPPATGFTRARAVWTGREMIVLPSTYGRYDPAANQWSAVAAADAPPISPGSGEEGSTTAVWTGSQMLVLASPRGIYRYTPPRSLFMYGKP